MADFVEGVVPTIATRTSPATAYGGAATKRGHRRRIAARTADLRPPKVVAHERYNQASPQSNIPRPELLRGTRSTVADLAALDMARRRFGLGGHAEGEWR
jgi:hypothetical protein